LWTRDQSVEDNTTNHVITEDVNVIDIKPMRPIAMRDRDVLDASKSTEIVFSQV